MTRIYDYIIIGAGPAGLQMGYYLKKNHRDYLILERASMAGSFFKKFPRHNILISINKVYTGYENPDINFRWDWNSLLSDNHELLLKHYSKEYFPKRSDLLKYLQDYANLNELNIRYKSYVNRISKANDVFQIYLKSKEVIQCKKLIVGTGVSLPYIPNIPGIECAKSYCDMSIKKSYYQKKRVLIIGKGNSGFETADHLVDAASLIHLASPNPLKMSWRSHYVGNLRAINNNILDTYQLKAQNGIINADIKKIEYKNNKYRVLLSYNLAENEKETIEYDHIILCAGFKFDSNIFDDTCKPELAIKDKFPKMTSYYESTNIKNLFFIGTIMQQRDYKKEQSGFIHGFRYNIAFLAKYLENRYHNKPFQAQLIQASGISLANKIIDRINRTSSLWQQTSYFCDLIVLDEKNIFHYYESFPVDFVHETEFFKNRHCFIITLEFGQSIIETFPDIFNIPRIHRKNYKNAHMSTFIHPVIRHYYNEKILSEHHIIEDFEGIWKEPEHIEPLRAYFTNELETFIIEPVNIG